MGFSMFSNIHKKGLQRKYGRIEQGDHRPISNKKENSFNFMCDTRAYTEIEGCQICEKYFFLPPPPSEILGGV